MSRQRVFSLIQTFGKQREGERDSVLGGDRIQRHYHISWLQLETELTNIHKHTHMFLNTHGQDAHERCVLCDISFQLAARPSTVCRPTAVTRRGKGYNFNPTFKNTGPLRQPWRLRRAAVTVHGRRLIGGVLKSMLRAGEEQLRRRARAARCNLL